MQFVQNRSRVAGVVGAVLVALLVAAGCTTQMIDEGVLAGDGMQGRNNLTPGSVAAQKYIITRLKHLSAVGLDTTKTGDEAFKQSWAGGTNIVAKIPGTDLANEYVVVGAHYDHLGSNCRTAVPADTICNGATDNAGGVVAMLGLAGMIKEHGAPRRTVVLAAWDAEEDGLLGSKWYVDHPLVPLAQTVGYVNFDIQGANLLPSLQNTSFAVGAETGGSTLTSLVKSSIATTPLQTQLVSAIFGQGRSDYVNFTNAQVPNVFFSDSTGPCYHTAQDEVKVVDFWKLDQQTRIGYRVVSGLANASGRPTFSGTNPLATYADAVVLQGVVHSALGDLARFTPTQQTQLLKFRDDLDAIVAAGAGAFDDADLPPLINGAVSAVNILTSGPCDGFISKH
jgi:hypothetical protein